MITKWDVIPDRMKAPRCISLGAGAMHADSSILIGMHYADYNSG